LNQTKLENRFKETRRVLELLAVITPAQTFAAYSLLMTLINNKSISHNVDNNYKYVKSKKLKPLTYLPLFPKVKECYTLYKESKITDCEFIAAYLLLFSQYEHERGWRGGWLEARNMIKPEIFRSAYYEVRKIVENF
jgi:hypothetical protein